MKIFWILLYYYDFDIFVFPIVFNSVFEHNAYYFMNCVCIFRCACVFKSMKHWHDRLPIMTSQWCNAKCTCVLREYFKYIVYASCWSVTDNKHILDWIEYNVHSHTYVTKIPCDDISHRRTSMKVDIDHIQCQATFVRSLHKIVTFLFPNATRWRSDDHIFYAQTYECHEYSNG